MPCSHAVATKEENLVAFFTSEFGSVLFTMAEWILDNDCQIINSKLLTLKGLSGCTLDCLHIYESFLGSEINNGALAILKATLYLGVFYLVPASISKVHILPCNTFLDKTGHFRLHSSIGHYLPHWYSKGINSFPDKEMQRSSGFLGNSLHEQV